MHHGQYAPGSADAVAVTVLLVVVALLVGAIVWYARRRGVTPEGLSRAERDGISDPQAELLSMLRQYGSPMLQSDLASATSFDARALAEAIRALEARELVYRRWVPEASTYLVSTDPWPGDQTSSNSAAEQGG